jgi:beta-glucosidase
VCLQVHASKLLLTDLLKVELGFRGLVVSDYNAVQQCGPSYEVALASCINAGVDMVMTAGGLWGDLPLEHQLRAARRCVEQGAIPLERIDDAVRRILRVKAAIGLPMPVPPPPAAPVAAPAAAPVPPPAAASQVALRMAADKAAYKAAAQRDQLHACVGCATHRRTAREAVRKSAVLLRLRNCVLPLKAESGAELLVCGRGADDLGMQCGGWTMQWQGVKGNSHTRGTTIWQAVQATGAIATLLAPGAIPPAPLGAGTGATAIAVLGEPP